jgi:hypothetical protein
MMRLVTIALAVALIAVAAAAQQHQPYAGFERRGVKALSNDEIADLRAGRGSEFALAAELNGYPGPLHVLEHADALKLSADQREQTRALFEAMRAETIPLGERLIEQEAELDRAFAERAINSQLLTEKTAAIGATRASLRAAHLRYHLGQVEVLSPQQTARYNELRGYAGAAPSGHKAHDPARHRAR